MAHHIETEALTRFYGRQRGVEELTLGWPRVRCSASPARSARGSRISECDTLGLAGFALAAAS